MKWFVGSDDREKDAYDVCVYSMRRHASIPLDIMPLKHRQLRKAGLFHREWRIDGKGQYWDTLDGQPFSTEFAFTRFLVPELAKGEDWAFFVDADFVFVADPAGILDELDASKAVMVVKHDFKPQNKVKMDGMVQVPYPRKNWSSLIAFNLQHEGNRFLINETVNNASGRFLHRFNWLLDDEIGALDPAWNWLVGHSDPEIKPKAYHFTDGGPWFEDWDGGPCDKVWREEFAHMQIDAKLPKMRAAE